jgi:hypothetical protein
MIQRIEIERQGRKVLQSSLHHDAVTVSCGVKYCAARIVVQVTVEADERVSTASANIDNSDVKMVP